MYSKNDAKVVLFVLIYKQKTGLFDVCLKYIAYLCAFLKKQQKGKRLFEETDKDPLFGDESGENLSYESLPADHPVTNYRARQVASCLRNNSPLSTPIKRISHQPK